MTDLLPCPDCGSRIINPMIASDGWTRVGCILCQNWVGKPSRDEASRSWNEDRPNSRTKRAEAYAKGAP